MLGGGDGGSEQLGVTQTWVGSVPEFGVRLFGARAQPLSPPAGVHYMLRGHEQGHNSLGPRQSDLGGNCCALHDSPVCVRVCAPVS